MKLLCWLLGHRNTISVAIKGKYVSDKCERCGALLPIAYPYHKEWK